jgi:cell wall-associated NlpC family hydrolase
MTVPGVTAGGADPMAAVQSRISEIQARFGVPDPVSFGTVLSSQSGLANQSGGLRTASSWNGQPSFSGTPIAPGARLPAGLSPAVDLAQQHLGVPYVWGGESPSGFDCSGLLQYVYGQLGVDLPRVAADQARAGHPVASLADAVPGDLVAFGEPVDHIGIYAGNGLMVVAPKTGDVVKVQEIYREPTAIRRVMPAAPGQAGLAGLSFGAGDLLAQRSGLLATLSPLSGAA